MPDLDYRQKAWSAGLIVLFFAGWELFCVVTHMSDLVLPRPSQIFVTLVQKFPILWPHILQTLATTMIGFVLGVGLGVVLGAVIGVSKTAYDTCYPLLIGFSSIPKVAVVPIFVLWFGSGSGPAPRPAQVKTVQGNEVRVPETVKPAPEIFTKEVVAPKDARSLQVIADLVSRIGGQARWKALKSYAASGSNSGEIKGSKVEWDFRAYRREPDKYAFILSSPVIGEVRQIYDAKQILLQTDFGTEESIDNKVGSNLLDRFAPIRVLMDD